MKLHNTNLTSAMKKIISTLPNSSVLIGEGGWFLYKRERPVFPNLVFLQYFYVEEQRFISESAYMNKVLEICHEHQ